MVALADDVDAVLLAEFKLLTDLFALVELYYAGVVERPVDVSR